ncbi:MAG TPA: UbiX family flavin prenyltransferase [Actinomycetota bacterium]|nr:UbiX family flavin prenyltransferase [Actinomycetota bacterium]
MSAESRQGRVVVGLTGGPGAAFGVRLLEVLAGLPVETHLVMCRCASRAIARETGRVPDEVRGLADRVYAERNQAARISSGSFLTLGMAIAPCSASTLASIGLGLAMNLVHRAADVTIKEGRPLVLLVPGGGLGPFRAEALGRLERTPGVSLVRPAGGEPASVEAAVHEVVARLGVGA